MDAVGALLTAQRADGAFLLRSLLVDPWALRIEDEAPLTVVVVDSGSAWLLPDGGDPCPLVAGDAVLVRGPGGYTIAGEPDAAPLARIGPGQVCTKPDGSPLSDFRDLGVRTWGNLRSDQPIDHPADGATVLLTGTLQSSSEVGAHLLRALPHVVRVPRERAAAGIVDLISAELTRADPGQSVVLDRLVDLLAVSLLRSWFSDPANDPPAWYRAYEDPVVGGALRRLHHEPAHPWTVATLAAQAHVSRATFARRFTAALDETPLAYLTRWRLSLAADLLRDTDLTLEAIAARVGYGSAFSLSAAFSRERGHSPSAHRRTARATWPLQARR